MHDVPHGKRLGKTLRVEGIDVSFPGPPMVLRSGINNECILNLVVEKE